jgi:hypothetical protein
MSLIIPANSLSGGYAVDNSCRFNDGSSDTLSKTFGSASSSNTTFTVSAWVKRAKLSANQDVVSAFQSSSGLQTDLIRFGSADDLEFYAHTTNASGNADIQTNRLFRDVGAWYHIVLALDTTQATASNRVKIYVNGVQETSFSTESYMNQNGTIIWGLGSGTEHTIGAVGTSNYFGGYVAEVCYIDGSQLDPTSFGEFDEDTGIWKPISVSGLTFGTNGFYLDFEDSAALGDDVSGNGNNFTVNNLTSIDQSTDTCTNNFCTINVLDNESGNITITEGNLNYTSTGGTDETNRCTFGFTKGKWYFESKYINDANYIDVGVGSASDSDIATPRFHMEMAGYYMLQIFTSYTKVWDNGSLIDTLAGSAENDIHMYAIDMDNNRFYAGKNGSWYLSGDPANNSNPLISMDNGYTTLMPSVCTKNDAAASLNFGSPSYSISSGNTDADGHGNFEYAVPSGFFSLCTKNLAEYG